MPIAQTSQFDMKLAGPIEVSMQVQTINDRNAILTGKRWEGMTVTVIETHSTYILLGGIDNTYWTLLIGGGGPTGTLVKTVLEVTGPLTINWDGTVPSGGQSFRELHGENFMFQGYYDDPGGYEVAYLPACRVTRDGTGAITTVQFGSVQPGRIIII